MPRSIPRDPNRPTPDGTIADSTTAITFGRAPDSHATGGALVHVVGNLQGREEVGKFILSIQDDHQANGRCLDWLVLPTKGTDKSSSSLGNKHFVT